MTTHHFGTDVDPSHYVEIPDTANPGQVKRPPAGVILKVRAAPTLADLPDVVTEAYGYWETTTTDISQIYVSGDNWVTSVGPLTSAEATTAGVNAGQTAASALGQSADALSQAAQALTQAQSALSLAQQAITAAGSGSGTFTGSVDYGSQVTNKPTIAPTSAISTPVVQSGSTYPTAGISAYGARDFKGTVDPATVTTPVVGDTWKRPRVA